MKRPVVVRLPQNWGKRPDRTGLLNTISVVWEVVLVVITVVDSKGGADSENFRSIVITNHNTSKLSKSKLVHDRTGRVLVVNIAMTGKQPPAFHPTQRC